MTLSEAISHYTWRKQACGFLFEAGKKILTSFCNRVDNLPIDRVSPRHVLSFLDGPRTSRSTWRSKYSLLRLFFEFWFIQGSLSKIPMPLPRPPERQIFTPYIFTRAEIRALLTATRQCQRGRFCEMDARTFRCLLITLYGTGASVGEILKVRLGDISFKCQKMNLSGSRVILPRTVPICPDLVKELKAFAAIKHNRKSPDRYLFCTKDGRPLTQAIVRVRFMYLRQFASVERHDGVSYQPRMCDLRSTFAVHRITSWIKEGADLNRMLPAMAAYMGTSGLVTTEQYLALTPERYRRQLQKLSPQKRHRRWRDDPALMKFLANL
jgi:integrase